MAGLPCMDQPAGISTPNLLGTCQREWRASARRGGGARRPMRSSVFIAPPLRWLLKPRWEFPHQAPHQQAPRALAPGDLLPGPAHRGRRVGTRRREMRAKTTSAWRGWAWGVRASRGSPDRLWRLPRNPASCRCLTSGALPATLGPMNGGQMRSEGLTGCRRCRAGGLCAVDRTRREPDLA